MTASLHLRREARLSGAVVLVGMVAVVLALAGGEASAAHVSCGDTITVDTTLDSDLVDCPNNGIVIGADDITLDLNGHTIDGDGELVDPCPQGEACDVGVVNERHNGVTIKNGTVTNFGTGVAVVRAKRNRLRHVATVENALEGIVFFRSARSRVKESTASRNGVSNSRPGIALAESHHNRITGNTMSGNGDLGLFMVASDHNLIKHNKARDNPEGGMLIEGDRNEFARNRLVGGGGGILITIVAKGGSAVGNVLSRNEVGDARGSGISVDQVPKRTLVSRNHVRGSGSDGFKVGSPSTKLTKNRAVRNGDLGIQAVSGVIDGGGNRASGNGDARQCVHVTCH
jgi:parallel beta-helix repeat protein